MIRAFAPFVLIAVLAWVWWWLWGVGALWVPLLATALLVAVVVGYFKWYWP